MVKEVAAFNQAFLNSVKRYGRNHEASLVLEYNARIMKPFKNAEQGPMMMSKGKQDLPEFIKGRAKSTASSKKSRQWEVITSEIGILPRMLPGRDRH